MLHSRGRNFPGAGVHQFATQISLFHLNIFYRVGGTSQNVSVQDNEISQLAFFQRPLLVFLEGQVSVIDGIKPYGLFACNPLFRVEGLVRTNAAGGSK